MDWEPRVGMRVVCIEEFHTSVYGEVVPAVGRVFTIREVEPDPDGDGFYLRFAEIVNEPMDYADYFGEAQFHQVAFRPLDERRLDIFRAVLTKAPTPEKEPA